MTKEPCVYILTNKPYGTLYTGMTTHIAQRLEQHKTQAGFAKRYSCHRLVYIAYCDSIDEAYTQEHRIKASSRAKKIRLIEKDNAEWLDLSKRWI